MTRTYANLSNCYKPLPFRIETTKGDDARNTSKLEKILQGRDSGNGQPRSPHGLRHLLMEIGVTSAAGSALIEQGHTKVLCEVVGPATSSYQSHVAPNMEEGTLECIVTYAANFGFPLTSLVGLSASSLSENSQQPQQLSVGRINTKVGAMEKELSSQLLASLSAVVPLQSYPKNFITIKITILQDDGSALSACTTAASLALIDAGIEVYDVVTSANVAVVATGNDNEPLLLADPTYQELSQADAVVTLSVLPSWKEVTLWNQSGVLSSEVANRAISLCRDGCRTIQKFMRNALLDNGKNSRDSQDDKMREE